MNEQSAQIIAANITLITVSLLATTLVVLFPTWRRFQGYWTEAAKESRLMTVKGSIVPVSLPLLAVTSGGISVLVSAETWYLTLPNVGFLLMLALVVPVGVYGIYAFCRHQWFTRKAEKETVEISEYASFKAIGVTSALCCFLMAVLISNFTVMAATPVAIGVAIGGFPQDDDFEFARAMLVSTPFTIFCGLLLLGFSYLVELCEQIGEPQVDRAVPEIQPHTELEDSQ